MLTDMSGRQHLHLLTKADPRRHGKTVFAFTGQHPLATEYRPSQLLQTMHYVEYKPDTDRQMKSWIHQLIHKGIQW